MEANLLRYRIEELEKFIQNRGNYTPSSIIDFDIHVGSKHDQCPLCGQQHDTYMYKTFNAYNGIEELIQYETYLCEDCAPEANMAELAADIQHLSIVALARISMFKDSGKLPADSLDTINPARCCFCLNHVSPNDREKIFYPVGTNNSNYNEVSSCNNCWEHAKSGMKHLTMDECYECADRYPITDEEMNARLLEHTVGQHLCSTCGLEYGLEANVDRFVDANCNRCGVDFRLDRSIHSNVNNNLFKENNYVLCNTCIQLSGNEDLKEKEDKDKFERIKDRLAEIYGAKFLTHVRDEVFAIIIRDTNIKQYYFRLVHSINDGKNFSDIYRSPNLYDKIEDAAIIAIEYGKEYCDNPQMKLEWNR